jgi:acetyl-CoA acetyltransferase
MQEVVIVAAGRTAVGKFGGSLAKVPAADLGAHVIKALMTKTGLQGEIVRAKPSSSSWHQSWFATWRTGIND